MKQHFSWLKTLEWLLTVVLVVLIALLFSAQLPTARWVAVFAVVSGSMEPTIPTGSVVITHQVPASSLKPGAIVAFAEPGANTTTILHRIVAISRVGGEPTFKTKGDANEHEDGWQVLPANIKGTAVATLPYFGYLLTFARTPLGFAITVGLPALVAIVLQLRTIKIGIDEEVRKRVAKHLAEHPSAF